MVRSFIARFLVVCCVTLICSTANAQDSHYWNSQFGTRSALMGGAVVGGVRDTSAGYYNPGALGFIDNPSLSVSANAYRYDSVTLDNGVGTGNDLDSNEINIIPLLLSGVMKIDGAPEHTLGYTIMTRNRNSQKASDRRDEVVDVLQNNSYAPGPEDYIGQYNFESDLTEAWAGLSYAYKPTSNVSVGITNFLALRHQRATETALARAINRQLFTAASADASSSVEFTDVRALWKLGVAADFEPVKFGLTVTTPSVDLFGDGTSARDLTFQNLDFQGTGTPLSVVADDRQDSLDANFRSPTSVAGGFEVPMSNDTKIGVTAEWFDKLNSYSVLSPKSRDFLRPSGVLLLDSADFLRLSHASDSVINYGIGVESAFTQKFTGILSLRTDFEAFKDAGEDQGLSLGTSNWDIYHATIGGIFKGEHSDLGIGLVYSFGHNDNMSQPVNFADPSEQNFLLGTPGETKVDYAAYSVIVGYTYYFS